MSLRMVARLLDVPYMTAWRATKTLAIKPGRVGDTYALTWGDIEQLATYFGTRRRRHDATHLH